ncbi:unnamed protein product, partial [Candidula unifasciata]
AAAPVSHQTGTEAKGIFTRGNIVASQNQLRATRSASVKSKIMSSQIDSSDRTDASVSGHVNDCQSEHTKTRFKSKNRKTRGYQCEQGRTINANQNEHDRSINANQNEHGRNRNANQNEHGRNRNANQNEHGRNRNANQNEHGETRNSNQNEHGGGKNANHSEHGGSRNVNQSELNRTRSDSKKRKTRGNQIEHSRTRATDQSELDENRNAKLSGCRSKNANDPEHGKGRSDPGKKMTGDFCSEHTNTEGTSTESKYSGCQGKHMVAQSATVTSKHDFASPVQGPFLTRTVHGAPDLGTGNQGGPGGRTVDRPAGEGIKTKKRRKRKRHASESETNCTSNRSREKTKAGDVFLHKKEDSRTKEQSSLEEGEIIDGGSSPLVRCQAHRKRRRHSYKAHDNESMTTSAPKKFTGKVEIVRQITDTPRGWQTVRQARRQAGGMEIKVMSYNILSQDLMNKHMYLYSKCRNQDLKWDNRGAALLTQIIAHGADIVCLQEVEKDHWLQDIRDTLAEQGYAGVYKKQSGDNTHGCAILFQTSKFKQLKSIPVEFMKGGILDRHNVGLILLLQPRQHVYGGQVKKICVATTHLLFNPRRGDVKLAQLMVLLAEIDKHAYLDDQPGRCPVNDSSKLDQESQSGGPGCSLQFDQGAASSYETQQENVSARYCPIILCGDFNMEPLCDLYQFITNGYLKYDQRIARLVCGQEEGRWGGTDRLVDSKLLPSGLDICETCQYLHVLKERWNRGGVSQSQPLPSVNSGQVWHSMNFQSVYTHFLGKGYRNREISTHHNNSSCTVDYIFYSQTATRHQRHAHGTGSNNSDSTVQVDGSQLDTQPDDSVRNRDIAAAVIDTDMGKDTVKEPLELIARYRLLKHKEVTKFGFMPNSVFPSDHLCLIAKFLLQ